MTASPLPVRRRGIEIRKQPATATALPSHRTQAAASQKRRDRHDLRAAAVSRMEPRVYRTKELLADGQTNKELVAKIGAIEPDSWAAFGGPGQMRSLPGVLIVAQNRHIHEQIGRLLASLHRGRDKPTK